MEIRTLDDARAWIAAQRLGPQPSRPRMSQARLASHLGVGQSAVGNWESPNQPEQWPLDAWLKAVQVLGHRVEVVPVTGRREALLARLRDASDALTDADLELLAQVAAYLPTASEDVRSMLTVLAGRAPERQG